MKENFPKQRSRPKKSRAVLAHADNYFRQFSELPFSDRERLVMEGISCKYLKDLILLLRIDSAFIERYLFLEPGLLSSMQEEDLFTPIVSDRIMALLELYSYGVEVIGEFELFNEWIKRPAENFIFHRPLDLLITYSGLLEVRNFLTEIKHGHY